MPAGCTGRPKRWGESPCRAQQLQHGRVGVCVILLFVRSLSDPTFIPQGARAARAAGAVPGACSLTRAGQSRQSSAALWVWAGGCWGALGTPPWEGNGGGGAPQVPCACLLSGPGEQRAAGPWGRETQRVAAETCEFRFPPMLSPHSLQCIPSVSVREMRNDRMAWRGGWASELLLCHLP